MIPDRYAAATPARQRWWPAWVGDVLAVVAVLLGGGVLLGLGLGGLLGGPRPPALGPMPLPRPGFVLMHMVEAALTVCSAGLMLLRRRWPVIVFAIALGCFVLAVLLGVPALGPAIGATIAAYAVAERSPRIRAFSLTGAAGGLIILLSLIDLGRITFDARIGAALVIAAALGDSARSRREYLQAVEDRAERAERTREVEAERRVSEERLRIARELHDTVAHQLTVINLHAGVASGYLDASPARAQEALGTIRQAARGALTEIGELLHYLRDEQLPSGAAPQQGLEGLDALLARMRDAGLDVSAEIEGESEQLSGTVGSAAYRVVQEALTNAHKHGSGTTARLWLTMGGDEVVVRVENPLAEGAGTDGAFTTESVPGGGLGLTGIRERVAMLHGSVVAGPVAGVYRLEVRLPLQERAKGVE